MSSSISDVRLSISLCVNFFLSIPKAILRATLRCGKRAPCCGTYPVDLLWGANESEESPTNCAPKRMVPPLGVSKPAIARKRVVLPQPEGPKRDAISPEFSEKERSEITFRFPNFTSRWETSSDVIEILLTVDHEHCSLVYRVLLEED